MSIETIATIVIPSLVAIYCVSLTIKAMASDDPSQYDPHTKLKHTARILKIFSRRFLLALTAFAVSLHFVISNFSLTIFAVITLNLSISWLLVVIYRDRTLRRIIHLYDRIDSIAEELKYSKIGEANPPSLLSNPLLQTKNKT